MNRFVSFRELCRQAAEGRDFIVELRPGRSALAVMAPHGGGIEPGTAALAAAIAGDEHGYYAFKGVRTRNNVELHIASERFDEPRALQLARNVGKVVTVHGCRGSRPAVYAGGLAVELKAEIINSLQSAGFEAGEAPYPSLAGVHRSNLCNRGRSGKGLQLELTDTLRRRLTAGLGHQRCANERCRSFVEAIRRVLAQFAQSP